MKELEKIVDSNGEPLEIVDAEARADISEIKQSLSDFEILEKTASGDIVSFDDGSDLPMPKLEVAIEPQQDLHGYDSPWAGGAGKNKANIADMNVQSQTTMGRLTLPSGTYVASATVKNNTSIGGAIKINTSSETLAAGEIPSASGPSRVSTASFTLSESTEILVVVSGALSGYNYDVSQVQIELGSIATSFAPYTNICPISGWDEVNVGVVGKNLCGELEVGTFAESSSEGATYEQMKTANGARIRTKELIPIFNNNIVISCDFSSYRYCFCLYDADKKYLGQTSGFASWRTSASTPSTPCSYIAVAIKRNDGAIVTSADLENCHLQVELGTTATTYSPYNGATYTIDLDGTRYGGTLDVISGVLTITDGYIASYNSEALPSTWISDRDVYAEGTTPTVGAEVVYKLATPQSAQLTPTQIISLLGVNNIYADTGDLELTYFVNNSLVQAIYDMLNILNS